ncbi:MAG: outer membrane beta-barrel protein [Flavobacteriales bacterium]|jgi:outer membrane protein W|tara:strand:+ start:438 stop:1046 length:609 start_codon:yes stop_codon:yes gene_type:complete
MKKLLFLTAIAVLTFNTSIAQEEVVVLVDETVVVVDTPTGFAKSDLYVSGTVGIVSVKSGDADETSTAYEISPSVGYFLSDNMALEAGLSFSDGFDDNTASWGANLGVRYFFSAATPFSFTVGAGLTYSSDKLGEDFTYNTIGFAIVPGINYFVSDAFALRASVGNIGFESGQASTDGAKADTAFQVGLDLSDILIGLTYKF